MLAVPASVLVLSDRHISEEPCKSMGLRSLGGQGAMGAPAQQRNTAWPRREAIYPVEWCAHTIRSRSHAPEQDPVPGRVFALRILPEVRDRRKMRGCP